MSFWTLPLSLGLLLALGTGVFLSVRIDHFTTYAATAPGINPNGNQTATQSGEIGIGQFQYNAQDSDGRQYACDGSNIVLHNGDGTTSTVTSCGNSNKICYAIHDEVGQKSAASCIDPGALASNNSCSSGSAGSSGSTSSIAQCQFSGNGSTGTYQSPKLLGYIDQVAQNTGVPAEVLAAIVKIESTVPNTYSITDYTDSDITQMEAANPSISFATVDQTISNSKKSICPRSPDAWALGVMQVLSSTDLAIPNGAGQHNPPDALQKGVGYLNQFMPDRYKNISVANLQLKDYCDVQTSLYLGAGLLQTKGVDLTVPTDQSQLPTFVTNLANAYEGNRANRGPGDPYYDGLLQSFSNCKPGASSSSGSSAQCTSNVGPGNNGLASGDGSDCPIPNGIVLCGSYYTPVHFGQVLQSVYKTDVCGHCGTGYATNPDGTPQSQCVLYPDGTKSAIDVTATITSAAGNDFAPITLPKVNGHTMEWTLSHTEMSGNGLEEIQGYSGTDTVTGEKYYLQLHHTAPGSGNTAQPAHSGDIGGKICGNGCGEYHTHIQIASGATLGSGAWLDAAKYFCQNNTTYSHF